MRGRIAFFIALCLALLCAFPAGAAQTVPPPLPMLRGGEPTGRVEQLDLEKFSKNGAYSDFHELFTTEELHGGPEDPYGDPASAYFLLQGACTDGAYCYFSFLLKLSGSVTVNARIACAVWENGKFRLRKLTVFGVPADLSDAKGNILHVNKRVDVPINIYHANDLTYNAAEDAVDVQYDSGKNRICVIPAACLRPGGWDYSGVHEQTIPIRIGAIDRCPALNGYILGVAGKDRHFAYTDSELRLISYFGYPDAVSEEGSGRQTVFSDGQELYAVHYLMMNWIADANGRRTHNNTHPIKARVEIYDLYTGEYRRTVECRSTETEYFVEGEALFKLNGRLYMFFNYIRSGKDRFFCFVDLTQALAARVFVPRKIVFEGLDGESAAAVGDVNADGRIDASDARIVFLLSRKNESPSVLQYALADANADGAVTVADCRAVLEYIVKF